MRHIVFFVVIFSFFFTSCASSKLAKEEKVEQFENFSLGIVENFSITPAMLENMQFFSGPDTIVLQRSTKVATGQVASDGTLLLTGGEPVKKIYILPHTPGVLTSKGIIFGSDKKIKELRISFHEKDDNSLVFVPSSDDYGTFVLNQNNIKSVLTEGAPLMIKLFYLEEQDQLRFAKGRTVGQKKTNTEKSIPDKKLVRKDYDD